MFKFKIFAKFLLALHLLLVSSCSTIESTMDSTWDSITEAGDYIYDSVNFWEDDEPEQSEAIIIEEAVEVPEYAIPEQNFGNDLPQQQNFSQNINIVKFAVGVKATTNELLGAEGREEGISSHAVVLLEKI